MNKETMTAEIKALVQDLLAQASNHRFFLGKGIKFPDVVIKEIKSYRALGRAGKKDGIWTIWVNFKAIEALGFEHYSKTTVPHEVAHIVCMFSNLDNGHGWKWRSVARHLGDTGNSCANKDESEAFRAATADMKRKPVYRYIYQRLDGREVKFTSHNHKKLQKDPTLLALNKLKPWMGVKEAV